jgi:hypothetical protein
MYLQIKNLTNKREYGIIMLDGTLEYHIFLSVKGELI